MKTLYDVRIAGVINGYVVSVGCEFFCFRELEHLLEELEKYLNNPEGEIKVWRAAYPEINDQPDGPAPCVDGGGVLSETFRQCR